MGDWDRWNPQHGQQHNAAARQASQFRSQSLPRLSLGSAMAHVEASSSNAHGMAAAGGPVAETNERFGRAARAVGGCLELVKELSKEANSARSFREKCSNLLGAAIAASLALQEALASFRSAGSELNVQHLATDIQGKLLSADALVRKYGHERILNSLVRFESKDDVEKKFNQLILELQALTNKTWDLIDPGNRIKRDVVLQGPAGNSSLTSGNAFARYNLRPASNHKVQALLAFPDEDGDGHDGVVAWAAHRNIKLVHLSSQVTTVLENAGEYLACMAYDKAGYIWSGHDDGTVRIWSLEGAAAAGSPTRIASATVTAVAVDPDTGYCWAGTAEGEVAVVRFNQQGSHFGKLDVVRQLLGFDAHSPTSRSIDSGSSHASSSQPIPVGNSSSSCCNTAGSSGGRQRRQHHHFKHKQHLSRAAASHPLGSGGHLTGLDLLESCLGSQNTGSGRVKDTCVHHGPVHCIVIAAGRAYTAGGSSGATSALLVWDSGRFELLRTISKLSTRWFRHPTTSMAMVCWATSRRGSGALSSAGSLPTPASASAAGSMTGSAIFSNGAASSGVTGTPRAAAERTLVTGHANGAVVMWDTSGDTLKPVLLVGPEKGGTKKAVVSVVVLEELGILVCGHANGKVYMRRLDPKTRLAPRDDANLSTWNPTTFSLQAHRLGLAHMVGAGHLLVTSGKTGSVKMWPETTIRCRASEAGIQLPHSHNPVSEAVNVLLSSAGLTAYASSSNISQLAGPNTLSPASSMMHPGLASSSAAAAGRQQQHQRHRSDGLPNGNQQLLNERSGSRPLPLQQQQQQPPLQAPSPPRQQQQQQQQQQQIQLSDAAAAAARVDTDSVAQRQLEQPIIQQQQQQQGQAGLQRNNSSTRWSQDLRKSSWMLEYDALGLDSNKRRVIGTGSYGRVEIGSLNQTDVAVKILTDVAGSEGDVPSSGTPADCPSWDEARLRALRSEVEILATLRHPNVVLFMGVCLAPPAVVTEYCPLGSLYDVLKKARSDRAMAARLNWPRRLYMALDAARGMLYLHSHKPKSILHRDLKSPNLFVTNALHVKVGDFNLSRYMALDASFVKSSLEINPRWQAPEVISEGYYSKAADVYAFGVVLWELLVWQEPWEEEGLGSFQIMVAVSQQQQRPGVPALEDLPGQLGPADAVAGYLQLMQDCWAQVYTARPSFEEIVTRLKGLLRMGGPNAAAGPSAAAAGVAGVAPPALAPPLPPIRNASDGALAARAAAAAGIGAGGAAAAAAGAYHQHSRSEVVGAAAAGLAGPEIADLLKLEEDDLPGPNAPAPPAAALPPISAPMTPADSSDDGLLLDSAAGSSRRITGSSGSSSAVPSRRVSAGVADAAADADAGVTIIGGSSAAGMGAAGISAAAAAAAAGLPPKPRQPVRSAPGAPASPFYTSSNASPFSPFAAAALQQSDAADSSAAAAAAVTNEAAGSLHSPMPQMPVSYSASVGGAAEAAVNTPSRHPSRGPAASPFAAAAAQSGDGSSSFSSSSPPQLLALPAALEQAAAANNQGGSPFARSPIRTSPFASPFAAVAGNSSSGPLLNPDSSHSSSGIPLDGITASNGVISGSPGGTICPLEAAVAAASAVDSATRATRQSGSGGFSGSSGARASSSGNSSGAVSGRPSVAGVAAAGPAAVLPAPPVSGAAAAASRVSSSSRADSSNMSTVASLAGGVEPVRTRVTETVASFGAWRGPAQQQQQQQSPHSPGVTAASSSSSLHSNAAAVPPAAAVGPVDGGTSSRGMVHVPTADLISLDSQNLDAQNGTESRIGSQSTASASATGASSSAAAAAAPVVLSPHNPFAAAAFAGLPALQ